MLRECVVELADLRASTEQGLGISTVYADQMYDGTRKWVDRRLTVALVQLKAQTRPWAPR